jgi:hypothetical protein
MLRAGNFYGRVGNVISPIPGLSGAQLRGAALQVALGNLGGACDYANIGTAGATAATSAFKVPGELSALLDIGKAIVGSACPAPTATTPTQQTNTSNQAQLDLINAQMAQTNLQMQQQAQQSRLADFAARSPTTSAQSKGILGSIKGDTLMYVGGAAVLAVAAFFLLRK